MRFRPTPGFVTGGQLNRLCHALAAAGCYLAVMAATVAQSPLPRPEAQAEPPAASNRQQPKQIGVFFWHDSPNDEVTFAGVQLGLRTAKVTATFVVRQAHSDEQLAIRQLLELQQLGCDLVLSMGTRATQLAQKHLHDVPIVFAAVTNPLTAGIVADWSNAATPPGQTAVCGASNWIAPRSVLDVFRLAVPTMTQLGMLRSRDNGVVSAAELTGMRAYLQQQGAPKIELHEVVVDDADGLPAAVRKLREQGVDAIWVPIDLTIYQHIPTIERELGTSRIPLLTTAATGVRNGALVGAAVDYQLHGRRAATLVQRVLQHGTVPPSIQIDRMHSSLVVVNLKAAQKNGIELPLSLLALADELLAPEDQ